MCRRSMMTVALILASAPAPASMGVTPAQPLGNPGEWVTSEDYPTAQLRAHVMGTAAFRLTISPGGAVAACEITGSSGSPELDVRTCELISRRATFEPGRDEDGQAVSSTYSNRVRWQIPTGLPVMANSARIEFDVDPDGSIQNCRVQSTPVDDRLQIWCETNQEAYFVAPEEIEKGQAGRRHVVMTHGISVSEPSKEKSQAK